MYLYESTVSASVFSLQWRPEQAQPAPAKEHQKEATAPALTQHPPPPRAVRSESLSNKRHVLQLEGPLLLVPHLRPCPLPQSLPQNLARLPNSQQPVSQPHSIYVCVYPCIYQLAPKRGPTHWVLRNAFYKHHPARQPLVPHDALPHVPFNLLACRPFGAWLEHYVRSRSFLSVALLLPSPSDTHTHTCIEKQVDTHMVTPTTAASATAGYSSNSASSSAGATCKPLTLINSYTSKSA